MGDLLTLFLFFVCFTVLLVLFECVIIKLFKGGKMGISEKDITLVESLIENDMLNYYIVSLISSDNEDTVEQWTENKVRILKLKHCLIEMDVVNKKEILKRIDDSISIIDKEIEKYG